MEQANLFRVSSAPVHSQVSELLAMASNIQETKREFKEKADDLLRSDGYTIENAINIFLDFCESDENMVPITQSLKQNTNPAITDWFDRFSKDLIKKFLLPTNDVDRLALLYQLLLKVRANEVTYYGMGFSGSNIHVAARQFNDVISRPLIRGLSNAIDKKAVSSPVFSKICSRRTFVRLGSKRDLV